MALFKNKTNRLAALLGCALLGLLLSAIRVLIINSDGVANAAGNTYYMRSSAAVTLFFVIIILALAAVAVMSFMISEYVYIIGKKVGTDCKAVSLLCSAVFAVTSLIGLVGVDASTVVFTVMTTLAGLIAAARFAMYGLKLARFKTRVFALLNLALPIFYAARMLKDFMQQSASPLDTSGLYHTVALAALMLFFLSEGEVSVGVKRKKLYLISGFAAMILLPVYSVPAILLYLTNGYGLWSLMLFSFADMAAWLYVLVRMKTVLSSRKTS